MKVLLAALLVLAVLILVALFTALPVMLLLNYLIAPTALVAVFGTAHIGFWQAYGVLLLCGLLFRSVSTTTSK